jgi:hypothetical protein
VRKKLMTNREYMEEFYKVNIRACHIDDNPERVERYVNELRLDIQDDFILMSLRSVEDAYQFALKEEEKFPRKQNQKNRERNFTKGRG